MSAATLDKTERLPVVGVTAEGLTDKLEKYVAGRDNDGSEYDHETETWTRLWITLTAKDGKSEPLSVAFLGYKNGRYRSFVCDCPPWQQHHKNLYAAAAAYEVQHRRLDVPENVIQDNDYTKRLVSIVDEWHETLQASFIAWQKIKELLTDKSESQPEPTEVQQEPDIWDRTLAKIKANGKEEEQRLRLILEQQYGTRRVRDLTAEQCEAVLAGVNAFDDPT